MAWEERSLLLMRLTAYFLFRREKVVVQFDSDFLQHLHPASHLLPFLLLWFSPSLYPLSFLLHGLTEYLKYSGCYRNVSRSETKCLPFFRQIQEMDVKIQGNQHEAEDVDQGLHNFCWWVFWVPFLSFPFFPCQPFHCSLISICTSVGKKEQISRRADRKSFLHSRS